MSDVDLNEKAGAAPTVTGLDDAKASCPAFSPTMNEEPTPEIDTSGVVGIDGADLLNRVRDDVGETGKVESMPKLEGRQMVMMIAPK